MTTCHMSVELGAYVLHALENDANDQVRRHLDDCLLCQEEVRDLSFTASLLSLVRSDDLEGLEAAERAAPLPGRRPDRSAPAVASRPARPGRRALLAAAVALIGAVSVPVVRASFDGDPPAPSASSTELRATDHRTQVRAAVSVAAQEGGTHVHLSLTGAHPGGWCSLVARSRDGRTDTAATWRADARGTADVTGTTAIPASRLSELDVVTDTGRLLVRIPVPGQDT